MIKSAGLLIYDWFNGELRVFLVHPGGPFWKNKPNEGWGIVKGKLEENEVPIEAAIREAEEEIGSFPTGKLTYNLGSVLQRKNKRVYCYGWNGRVKLPVKSNMISQKIGEKVIEFPEIDIGKWFSIEDVLKVIINKQKIFIERLLNKLW